MPSARMTAWMWTRPRRWYSTIFHVGEPDLGFQRVPRPAGQFRQRPGELEGEAPPEVADRSLPDHGPRIVVAVPAQRSPDPFIILTMTGETRCGTAMLTGGRTPWMTRSGPGCGRPLADRVDGPEAGRGQRGEDPGMRHDGVRDAFAAIESGSDQLIGVALVQPGAGGADRATAVAAAHEDDAAGGGAAVEGGHQFPGTGVGGAGVSGQVDGVGAAPMRATWPIHALWSGRLTWPMRSLRAGSSPAGRTRPPGRARRFRVS